MSKPVYVNRTIRFRKVASPKSQLMYREVTDAYILNALEVIRQTYSFTVTKMSLKGWLDKSYIRIKCQKDDWYPILIAFVNTMGDAIHEVNI